MVFIVFPHILAPTQLLLPTVVGWIGVLSASFAILLLVWTHRTLKGYWTKRLQISPNHKLVIEGPYRHLRHPMYLALCSFYGSIALMSANTVIMALSVMAASVLLLRIRVEEAMLIEHFSDAYPKYIQNTRGLIGHISIHMGIRGTDGTTRRPIPMWYRLLRSVGRPLVRILWDIRVEGQDRIPKSGGFVLVANHSSWADTVLIGYAFSDLIHYLTDSEWYFRWYLRPIAGIFGLVPICKGKTTMSAVRQCVQSLHSGKVVGVFPEGRLTRDGNQQNAAAGAGLIAKTAKVPILPVALEGAYYAYPYHRRYPRRCTIRIKIGQAVLSDDRDCREFTTEVMTSISRLMH